MALVHAQAGDATFLLGRSSGEWQSWAAEKGIEPLLEFKPQADAARCIVVAVPDPDLEDAAMETAARLDGGEGRTVVHVSGIHGLAPLAPFSTLGAATGALHPLLPFAKNSETGGIVGSLATLLAAEADAPEIAAQIQAVVCLAYPFHPAGKPDRPRTAHLADLATPTLIVQGDRDALGNRDEVAGYTLSRKIQLHWCPDGNHDLTPSKRSGFTQEGNWEGAMDAVAEFLRRL